MSTKRCIRYYLFALSLLLFGLISTVAEAEEVYSFQNEGFERVPELQQLFQPESKTWYWNHWSGSTLGNAEQRTLVFSHRGEIRSTTISTKSCAGPRSNHDNKSTATCNSYDWGTVKSSQCMGYADMIFDLMWDMDPMDGYFMYCNPSTDNVGFLDLPGVDYRGCQLYNKAAGHTVIILNSNTSKITVTDCNHEPLCKIRWFADYKTKSDVSVKGSYIISPVPIVVEDSYCNWNH